MAQQVVLTLLAALLAGPVAAGCVTAAGTSAETPGAVVQTPQVVRNAMADLAARLKLQPGDVKAVVVEAGNWPDAALGLHRPDMFYTQALVPGYRVVLEAGGSRYSYHTSATKFQYAGPEALWKTSVGYLQQIEDEPNLNGMFMQVSPIGAETSVVGPLASDFGAGDNGSILTVTRTSRSGHLLCYLAVGETGAGRQIAAASDFASPVFLPQEAGWAVFARESVDGPWSLWVSHMPAADCVGATGLATMKVLSLRLGPRVLPTSLSWRKEGLLALVYTGGAGDVGYLISEANGRLVARPQSLVGGDSIAFTLKDGRTLKAVGSEDGNGVPAVELTLLPADAHPGQEGTHVARLVNMSLDGLELAVGERFALVKGVSEDTPAAVAVDITTGETYGMLHATSGRIHFLNRPVATQFYPEGSW